MSIRPVHTVCYPVSVQNGVGSYLLLRRCGLHLPGVWQGVTGRIEGEESASQAALRELKEETGFSPQSFYSADILESFYDVARGQIFAAPVFVAFVDSGREVRLCCKEHDASQWVSCEEALSLLSFRSNQEAVCHIEENLVQRTPFKYLEIPCVP